MPVTSKRTHATGTNIHTVFRTLLLACLLAATGIQASDKPAAHDKDPHYIDPGFFDIHVCNWPDRTVFFMILFSTVNPDAVKSIEVLTPEAQPLVQLDLSRYRTIEKKKDAPEKRVFINQVEIPPGAGNGWYSARITLVDGNEYEARDFVKISRLPQTGGQVPANGEEAELPHSLRWDPVPGAGFYQVFIRDLWDEGKLIYSSKLVDRPELVLPGGLLEPGGYYSWIVHARDTNEDIMLGDFNHGSLNRPATFTVAP